MTTLSLQLLKQAFLNSIAYKESLDGVCICGVATSWGENWLDVSPWT